MAEDTPPEWMLKGELPTVSSSTTSLTTKIDFATGMLFDDALENSLSASVSDELPKQKVSCFK